MKQLTVFLFFISVTIGYSQDWKTDFELVKNEAKNNNKTILLLFSGSDWCAPCIKLEKNIWQSAEFKKFADQNYALLRADFPKKKQNQLETELKQQNEKLAEKYNPEGVFPLVVIMDKTGKILGKASYQNVTPAEYLSVLNTFVK